MNTRYLTLIIFILASLVSTTSYAKSRIKDISSIEGMRDNMLVGYGLVVGLNGTGDNMKKSIITKKLLTDFLEKHGANFQGADLKAKNVAAVAITAYLPPFAKQGSRMDVRVSAMGDAKSLKGGSLVPIELIAANGNAYAVAQGLVSIQEFNPVSEEVKNRYNAVLTSGIIKSGGIVEREVNFNFNDLEKITLFLHNPDLSTASKVSDAINNYTESLISHAIDPGTITVEIPYYRKDDLVNFIAELEQIEIVPDNAAKVVINETTGTIVIGNNVQIRPVAIAQGNILINVGYDKIEDKLPLIGENKREQMNSGFDELRGTKLQTLDNGTTLANLVDGLNKLKVYPRDMIDILQTIKAAGAMDAEILVQ